MSLDLVKQAERAELRALRKAARRERHRERWAAWVAFWERAAKHLKVAATVITSLGVIGGFVWRAVVFYRSRDVGAVLPAPTGAQTTALDFVTKHPPDGGQPK